MALDAAMAGLLAVAGAHMLVWRAGMLPELGVAGWAFFVLEAIVFGWMMFTAFLLVGRTRPDRVAPDPDPEMTLDVLIPTAGEPMALLAATIAAAKAIRWPHNVIVCNDSYLAGKANWREVEALCEREGVHCLTRTTGPKGKAGNLNHALARIRSEAFLVIDADHQVVPDVAHQMLGWLRHPEVAFVCTPQEFAGSARDSLNPTDPVFYRAIQPARDRHGLAFSTGNGVLYRREAVVRIGGFSEWSLVEDLHSSIRLHDAGWSSVFHPRPVSVGLAPATAAEYAKQRLRWAVDSIRILRHDPPWRRSGLSLRAKAHYAHTLLTYFTTMLQVGFLLGPPAWILARASLVTGADWQAQAWHIFPWLAAVIVILVRWAGVRGAWRSVRLTMTFLPVLFWVAAWRVLSPIKLNRSGAVTAKSNQPRINGLVLAGLALPFGLLASMVWAVFDPRPGGSDLAMGWGALMVILAVGPLLQIGYRRFWPGVAQFSAIGLALAVTAGSVATARFGWDPPGYLYQSFRVDPALAQATIEVNELGDTVVVGPAVPPPDDHEMAKVDDEPMRVALAAADGVYVGFTSDPLPFDLAEADRWAAEVTEPQIVHWYQQWGSGESRFRGDWLAEVAADGRIPMVSWEAWAKPKGGFASATQELGELDRVVAGEHDDYIDEWAVAAAEYGHPILLRPFHEMNGYWYPWSVGVNGNTAEDYVGAWRHVVDRFRVAGADNVSFVWSINTLAGFEQGEGVEEYYPGDDYVDWVATSGFNWDDYDPEWSSWVTAEWVFGPTYEVLAQFDKPVMFAEIGTGKNGGDEAQWVADGMEWFATLPELKAIVWFDRSYDGGVDFRLGPGQQAAVAAAVEAAGSPFAPALVTSDHPMTDGPSTLGSDEETPTAAPGPPVHSGE